MTLEERLHHGSRAKEVLENEAYIDAFESIKTDILEQWTNSPARDADGREKLWTCLKLLQKVQTQLQTTLETGKLAQLELQHKQTLQDRLKAGWGLFTE
ncbi:MAG: hypothetical protein EBY24_19235 [Betaproteobacteria bacterium]|nr:hypothetical protein [Betaproteobacteria bacterium]